MSQKPVKEIPLHTDGGLGESATIEELWKRSDAVVECLVETERALDDSPSPGAGQPLPYTVYGLRLIAVFKADSIARRPNDVIFIKRLGALLDRGDHIDHIYNPKAPLFKKNQRYILFLRLGDTSQTYLTATGSSDSVFRIDGKNVQSFGTAPLTESLVRYSAPELIAKLKALGGVP